MNAANVRLAQNPYNKNQLQEKIDEVPENHVEDTRAEMEKGIEANLTATLNAIETKYQDYRSLWKKRYSEDPDLSIEQKEQKYQDKVKELDEVEQSTIARAKATAVGRQDTFNEYLDYFTPGQGLEIPVSIGGELQLIGVTHGVFLQFKINKNRII